MSHTAARIPLWWRPRFPTHRRCSMRTLIRDARLCDGELTVAPADVVLEDDRIDSVGADAGHRADVEVDGGGRTLLPGLVDAHTHVFDGSLAEALRYRVTTEFDVFCLPQMLPRQRRL